MKISLVTVSFNQRKYLERTLRSVFEQRYPCLDYIIIDPGSTDGSRELIAEHQEKFTRVVLEPDRGPADGLNKGFALASGDVYGFLNADDLLLPNSLSAVAEHMANHPECDVVMGDGLIVDGDDRVLRKVRARPFSASRYLHSGSAWLQQSTFFRSGAFKNVGGFNAANRSSWDGELFLKMALAGARFQYLHKSLASFRLHGESITSRIQKGGRDQTVLAYQADGKRIFEEAMGRPWSLRDDLLTFGYRFERLALHPRDLAQAILHRVRARRAGPVTRPWRCA
jgi:glycosyltransferase involved in cell wall biosynthesis